MSNNETLSRPYAKALFEHSEGWVDDLELVSSTVSNLAVANLIDSPQLAYPDKVEELLSIVEGEVQPKSMRFLRVLGESKRLSLLPDITNQYRKLIEAREDKKTVVIFTPFEVSVEQVETIKLSLKKYFGKNLVVKRKLDQALIGGFLAKSGGDVFDASIKGKLEDLKNQIL